MLKPSNKSGRWRGFAILCAVDRELRRSDPLANNHAPVEPDNNCDERPNRVAVSQMRCGGICGDETTCVHPTLCFKIIFLKVLDARQGFEP